MNVEIGTEATQFPEKEYINGIFLAVHRGEKGRGEIGGDRLDRVDRVDRVKGGGRITLLLNDGDKGLYIIDAVFLVAKV
jgi:hypothetical protein